MAYRGFMAPVYVGSIGLYGGKDLENAPPNALLRANNVEYSGRTIRKEAGTVRYNPNTIGATTVILAGVDWQPSGSLQSQVIFTSSGSVLSDQGSATFNVTAVSALNATTVAQFVEGGHEQSGRAGRLFLFSGVNAVHQMIGDATSMSPVTTAPADWASAHQPYFGVIHENRLWGGGNLNDPSRVYYSSPTAHDRWDLGGSISVYPGDAGELVAGISFKGLLIVFKNPRGIYAIDTSNSDTTLWRVIKLTSAVGAINAKSVTQVVDDVLFVDRTGSINLLSGTSEFGDIKSSSLSDLNAITELIRDNVARGQLGNARVEYYEDRREVHVALPVVGSTANDRRLVIDFNEFPTVKFRFSDRDVVSSFWTRIGSDGIEKLVYGSSDGFVRIMDQDSFTHDSAGYEGLFETVPVDFGHLDPKLAGLNKNGQFLDITAEVLGDYPFNVGIYWDRQLRQQITINPGEGAAVLGSFVLGEDKLTTKTWKQIRKRVVGSGRKFSMVVRQSDAETGFSIGYISLMFNTGAVRS